MRRKEETLRRQEKQTHSVAAEEERSEGRNEPLSDWNAIVADDVSVFPRPGPLVVLVSSVAFPCACGDILLWEVWPEASSLSSFQATRLQNQHHKKPYHITGYILVKMPETKQLNVYTM